MIDFRIERGWSFDGYQLWIMDYRNGRSYIAKPVELTFVEVAEGGLLPEPTLKIGGPLSRELLIAVKTALAGVSGLSSKEAEDATARVERAMAAHIESLKFVVERVVK